MKVGSLFSGIGGFDLGLQRAGMEIRWQVEIDPYCNKVLEKNFPNVRRYGDIKTIDPGTLEPVDLICGGFPCQPFSLAGKRRGKEDDRYLWPEMLRIIEGVRPSWVIGENVPGIIRMGLDAMLFELEGIGYDFPRTINGKPIVLCIPAASVGAPHRRERVWILAHSVSIGVDWKAARSAPLDQKWNLEAHQPSGVSDCGEIGPGRKSSWPTGLSQISRIPRMDDRPAHRMDRLRGLGNAVVPQIVEFIGRKIMEV